MSKVARKGIDMEELLSFEQAKKFERRMWDARHQNLPLEAGERFTAAEKESYAEAVTELIVTAANELGLSLPQGRTGRERSLESPTTDREQQQLAAEPQEQSSSSDELPLR